MPAALVTARALLGLPILRRLIGAFLAFSTTPVGLVDRAGRGHGADRWVGST
ncbi:MAG TPA: hypothetical protein VFP22_01160 [Candidatus Limnocylindrales bacterium]|nr:hypothetical protein [Candidatus Limnocylindrales bacterium]